MADLVRFTELLFSDQTLDDLLTSLDKEVASDGAWMLLSKAAEHMRQGQAGRAAEMLLEVVDNPKMKTRILLWSWAALRCLGVHPTLYEANDIKGVVIQLPMKSGVDVLAAYTDGTARYINYSGKVLVWEISDATITAIIRKLLESCKNLCGVLTAPSPHFIEDSVCVTLLTFNGNWSVETQMHLLDASPIERVLGLGAELLGNLIRRSESMDRLISQTSGALNF